MQYTDIKTYEDACKAMGTTPEEDLPYAEAVTSKQKFLNAAAKLETISDALNNDAAFPDWSNYGQYKYTPYLFLNDKSSGLGLSYGGCVCDGSVSSVGSRLVFNSREIAKYAATQFIEVYKDFMLK